MDYDDRYGAILDLIEDLANGSAFANAVYERLGLGDPPQQIVDGLAETMASFITTAVCESDEREWARAHMVGNVIVGVVQELPESARRVFLHWPAGEKAPDTIPDHVTVVEER